MATTNNLGRVQGISLWVADGVVTTTGTITLTNSTMHPLINDNVIDTNGNVFKITGISGTNPYTITTSGTPIYQIKGSEEEWDDVIVIGAVQALQIVSSEIEQKLINFKNVVTSQDNKNNYFIIETSAWGVRLRSSEKEFYVYNFLSYYDTSYNYFIEWGVDNTITYNYAEKYFTGSVGAGADYEVLGAYIKYKVIPTTATQNSTYTLEDINAVSLQEAENTFQFNNEEFKNKLQQSPHLTFLTIYNHEFRGFFLENNLYKHIDNEYQINEETKQEELVKTYTCTIDLTNNLITYNENDIINVAK